MLPSRAPRTTLGPADVVAASLDFMVVEVGEGVVGRGLYKVKLVEASSIQLNKRKRLAAKCSQNSIATVADK